MPYSVTDILQVINDLTQNANGQDGIFLLSVSAGNSHSHLQFQTSYDHPNVVVYRTEIIPQRKREGKVAKWINTQSNHSF